MEDNLSNHWTNFIQIWNVGFGTKLNVMETKNEDELPKKTVLKTIIYERSQLAVCLPLAHSWLQVFFLHVFIFFVTDTRQGQVWRQHTA